MRIRVLGSAAGGGFPQWNCGCGNCQGLRSGSLRAVARRQESVAISADGKAWFLLNASPEIREQIESFPPLSPWRLRHSPIAGIVLTNGDLDHCLGLLSLRESQPIKLYATDSVRVGFTDGNVLYRTLERCEGQVTWRTLALGVSRELEGNSEDGSLSITAFPVPGKRPIHLEEHGAACDEDNVGLLIQDRATDRVLAYVPAAARWTSTLDRMLARVQVVFFDGTFWSSMELRTEGVGHKRAEDMAHLPMDDPTDSLAHLSRLGVARRILVHINNTNPLLREDSRERAETTAAGVEVAFDGMEIDL